MLAAGQDVVVFAKPTLSPTFNFIFHLPFHLILHDYQWGVISLNPTVPYYRITPVSLEAQQPPSSPWLRFPKVVGHHDENARQAPACPLKSLNGGRPRLWQLLFSAFIQVRSPLPPARSSGWGLSPEPPKASKKWNPHQYEPLPHWGN